MRDFIKKGEPITSDSLFDSYKFGIKPAMIRWELNGLDEAGYLTQLYTSSGRVPTAKAYQFFVNDILNQETDYVFADLANVLMNSFWRDEKESFVEEIAKELRVLSVGYEAEEARIYNSGLKELVENFDFKSKNDLIELVRDFEFLGENLASQRKWWLKENSWPQVFIGKSPITKCEHLSVLMEKLNDGGSDFILAVIGPKRMDYEKSLKVLKSLGGKKKNKKYGGRTATKSTK